jgi:hypothetical protein
VNKTPPLFDTVAMEDIEDMNHPRVMGVADEAETVGGDPILMVPDTLAVEAEESEQIVPVPTSKSVALPSFPSAEPVVVANPAAVQKFTRPKVLPIQIQFVLDLPSLEEFQKIITIPTVGTELEKAKGMSITCHQDINGVLLPDNNTVNFVMRSLTVWQLRRFGIKFDVPQSQMIKKDQCFVNLMVAFQQNSTSVKTSISKRVAAFQEKLNAMSIATNRLISTLFGSTYKALYAQLNNPKDHSGFEITFGANNKIFWNNVVDSVNSGTGEGGEEGEDTDHKFLLESLCL